MVFVFSLHKEDGFEQSTYSSVGGLGDDLVDAN